MTTSASWLIALLLPAYMGSPMAQVQSRSAENEGRSSQQYVTQLMQVPQPTPQEVRIAPPRGEDTPDERRAMWEPIIREAAEKWGADGDLMVEIARCESGFRPYRWNYMNPTGDPKSKWSAYGMFQVIASHERTYGVSRMTLEGNIEIAMKLYLKNGTTDWKESRNCWGSKRLVK